MARRSRPGGNIRWKVGTDHLFWSVPVAMDCQSGHAIPWRPEMDSACFGESRVRVGSHSIGTKVVESSDPGGGKGKRRYWGRLRCPREGLEAGDGLTWARGAGTFDMSPIGRHERGQTWGAGMGGEK